MQVFLIGTDTRTSPRWGEAFPGLTLLRPPLPEALPAEAETCWIDTQLPDWETQVGVAALAHRVVVHSPRPNDEEGMAAFDAGAHGYCHSLVNAGQLRAIEHTVTSGGLWVGADLMSRMIRTVRRRQPKDPIAPPEGFERLTPREREVALAVTTGAANKTIARQLGLTERTVKMHLGAAFQKLGVTDRVQLVLRLTRADAKPNRAPQARTVALPLRPRRAADTKP